MTRWRKVFAAAGLLAALGLAYWRFAIPKHRVAVRSELIMLGDLDGDRHWREGDLEVLETTLREPFLTPDATVWKLDFSSWHSATTCAYQLHPS